MRDSDLRGLCDNGKIAAHFVTMIVYISLGVWVILAKNERSRITAGYILLGISILGCVPLFMWRQRLSKT